MANVGIGLIGCGGMGRHVARLLQITTRVSKSTRSATLILAAQIEASLPRHQPGCTRG